MNIQELFEWIESYELRHGNVPKYIGLPYEYVRLYIEWATENKMPTSAVQIAGLLQNGIVVNLYNTVLVGSRKYRKFTPLQLALVEVE